MDQFEVNNRVLLHLLEEWEAKLLPLTDDIIALRWNKQNRTIKQILGHMIDSASNNTHRIIHLQYQADPLIFPDYAAMGNNDRWIAIQDYQSEDWDDLVRLWKYSNRHIIHVIRNINPDRLDNEWITGSGGRVSLKSMILDYLPHFELHLNEIDELIKNG